MADIQASISKLFLPTHEGTELSLDSNDKGNWTGGQIGDGELRGSKFGISAASFPDVLIAGLTENAARAIYVRDYTSPLYAEIRSQSICNSLIDFGVTSGVKTSVGTLQHAVAEQLVGPIALDGVFGPQTLEMVNACDPDKLLRDFVRRRIKFYFADAVRLIQEGNADAEADFRSWLRRALDW